MKTSFRVAVGEDIHVYTRPHLGQGLRLPPMYRQTWLGPDLPPAACQFMALLITLAAGEERRQG